jgi:hypothetical protein
MKTKPIAILVCALALAACSSTPKSGNMSTINPIIIPDGLTQKETAAAIVNTIVKTTIKQPSGLTPRNNWEAIVDGILDARVWGYQSQFGQGGTRTTIVNRGWYVESINKDIVTLGYKQRRYYLSVRLEPAGDSLVLKILASENLRQNGDNIHPGALGYISSISADIRKSLGYISILKSQILEGAKPETPAPPLKTTFNPILIPANLTSRDATAGMVQTIIRKTLTIDPARPQPADGWEAIIDSLLNAQEPGYRSQFQAETHTNPALRSWYVESVENNAVVFGFRAGRHYMSVRMEVGGDQITPLIIMAENIMIEEGVVHPDAVQWITDLSVEIRKTLGELSTLKFQVMELINKRAPQTNPVPMPKVNPGIIQAGQKAETL